MSPESPPARGAWIATAVDRGCGGAPRTRVASREGGVDRNTVQLCEVTGFRFARGGAEEGRLLAAMVQCCRVVEV